MAIAPPAHTRTASTTDDWITPRWLVEELGPFDLDPCECLDQPWRCAVRGYSILDDGLSKLWRGFVWMNPPYGRQTINWLSRLSDHGNGLALVFARTETRMFFEHVWPKASAVMFVKGRLTFHRPDGSMPRRGGNSGGPSVLIAYGQTALDRLDRSGVHGRLVVL